MDQPLQLEQLDIVLSFSPVLLLERGCKYIQQSKYAEGVALFILARDQLPHHQPSLVAELDVFLQACTDYQYHQFMLQEASKRIAEAHAGLEAIATRFEQALSACVQNRDVSHHHPPIHKRTSLSSCVEEETITLPALSITCLGCFEVRRHGKSIKLCQSRSGQGILRYLVAQRAHSATADMLQGLFWPEDEPSIAQRKLHSAISALRRSLNEDTYSKSGGGYITCKNRVYALNPDITIQCDTDEFLRFYQLGKQDDCKRVEYYEQACQLYTRPFLLEDMYADWSSIKREQLSQAYFTMCRSLVDHYFKLHCYEEAAEWANAILLYNRCDEAAHRELIQIYAAQGRRNEALRQYHRCKQVLYEELAVPPARETTHLFQSLLTNSGILFAEENM